MAETDPVKIVVDIVDQFSDDLKELEAKLEKIDNMEISPELDIDASEEIKKVQAQLQKLKKEIEADLDIDVDGAATAQAVKSSLSKDMRSTLHIDTDSGGGIPPPLGADAMSAVRETSRSSLNTVLDREGASGHIPKDVHPGRLEEIVPETNALTEFTKKMQQQRKRAKSAMGPDVLRMPTGVTDFFEGGMGAPRPNRGPRGVPTPTGGGMGNLSVPGFSSKDRGNFDFAGANKKANKAFKGLSNTLRKLKPNMMMVWNTLAALIPVFIALAGAAVGLAAGLIAIATAGAAIVGLGLLGWGEDLESSMKGAKEQAKSLGSRLFDILQPVADMAQPVLKDWMKGAPRQVQKLVNPLQNLIEAFSGPLSDMGAGIADWLAQVIQSMASMDGMITQIIKRFGRVAGNAILDFMENMVVFAYQNQEALINMAHSLRMVGRTLLNISVFVIRVISVLKPLIDLVAWASQIFKNKWVAALTASTIAAIVMVSVLTSVAAAAQAASFGLLAMALNAILVWIGSMQTAIVTAYEFVAALGTVQAALVATGVGAFIVGAGYLAAQAAEGPEPADTSSRRRGGSRGSGGAGNTVIIEGNVEKQEMNRLMDRMGPTAREEQTVSQKRDK